VLLCITADGHKLPSYITLNRKTVPKNEVLYKQKDRMTADLMEDWVKMSTERDPGALHNPPSMLVLDAFRGHSPEELEIKLKRRNCDLVLMVWPANFSYPMFRLTDHLKII
jgi:hypothetical protein